jgi:hypothetical protein
MTVQMLIPVQFVLLLSHSTKIDNVLTDVIRPES